MTKKTKFFLPPAILFLAAAAGVLGLREAAFHTGPVEKSSAGNAEAYRIPVNRAAARELHRFLGISMKAARAVARQRKEKPFNDVDDFMKRARALSKPNRKRVSAFLTFAPTGKERE